MKKVARNEVIIDEIIKECNWKEKIIVNTYKKVFIKVYNISRINTVNQMIR